jgi:hypothetical protein
VAAVSALVFLKAVMWAGERNSYAPPVSRAELGSARVGATLGRPINAAELFFFFFLRGFFFFFGFLVLLFLFWFFSFFSFL